MAEGEAKSNAVAANMFSEAGHECCSHGSRMNGLPAIAPQARATEKDLEGGLDEVQPRNCYRAPWEPTRENIDALFRDVDDMVEWFRSQDHGEMPNELLPNDDHTSELDALFQEVDAILELDLHAPWNQDPGSDEQGSTQDLVGDRAQQASATAAVVAEPSAFVRVGPGLGANRETELAERVEFHPRGIDSEGSGHAEDGRLSLRSVD